MADRSAPKVKAADKVRVHHRLPSWVRSFVEGVVPRTDVSTLRGRVFVVDVTSEVVLKQERALSKNNHCWLG